MATARRSTQSRSTTGAPNSIEEMYQRLADATNSTVEEVRDRHLQFLDAPPEPLPEGCLPFERLIAMAVDGEAARGEEKEHLKTCVDCGDYMAVFRAMRSQKRQSAADKVERSVLQVLRDNFEAVPLRVAQMLSLHKHV